MIQGEKTYTQSETEEQQDVLEGMDFDTAEAALHTLRKHTERERRRQDALRKAPTAPYAQRRRREDIASGRDGTSKRSIEERTTKYAAINAELREDDDGGQRYKEAQDRHENLRGYDVIGIIDRYGGLFEFLGESKQANPNVLTEYEAITGTRQRLGYFHSASFADKITLLCSDNFGYANYDNFQNALQFQQDFINGEAKIWQQRWQNGKYVDVQHTLDPANANQSDIHLGLKRAGLKSAMIGTPEYAAWKMALQIRAGNEDEYDRLPKDEYPTIKGYWSGITEDSIGNWSMIIEQYQKYADKYAKRRPELEGNDLEYGAVRNVAHLYAKSMQYQPSGRSIESPYTSTFAESLAWAQLGEGVQAQLRGMRQKIMDVDLHNIERFIGKSGTSEKLRSYRRERYFLDRNLEITQQGGDEATALLEKENAFEIGKQERWRDRELARIEHKWDKKIGKTRSEDRIARYQEEKEAEIQRALASYNAGIAHYQNRDLDTFISDMQFRQEITGRRIGKRKSIAEKAIDLHFALSVGSGEWDEDEQEYVWHGGSEYGQVIDWINDAPFGTIKRAHQRMQSGMSTDDICKSAISEIITKIAGDSAVPELEKMFANFQKDKWRMQQIMQLSGELSGFGIKLDFDELRSLSEKDTRWIRESLQVFEWNDVKQFIDNGLNLSLVPKISRVTGEFGYSLDTTDLIDFTKGTIINRYYYKEVEGILSSTLREFSLDETKQMMREDIDLKMLRVIQSKFPNLVGSDHEKILEMTKLATAASAGVDVEEENSALGSFITHFSEERAVQLYQSGASASKYEDIFDNNSDVSEKVSDLQAQFDILGATKERDAWQIQEAVRAFSPTELSTMIEQKVDIVQADSIRDGLAGNSEFSGFNTFENILFLAKNNLNLSEYSSARLAGFADEEIQRYPFLASKLYRNQAINIT